MKVAILGAGAQGYVLTWHFARRDDVDEIVLGDYEEQRAKDVAVRWGAGKTTAAKVDASDPDAVARFAAGADIIVNAVLPEWVVPVMHGALAVGAHYLDMATRTPGVRSTMGTRPSWPSMGASGGLVARRSSRPA